ncbi:oxysterol binding protein 9, putative [Pediculus humanus corporis]|uniref:Oxysterol-binding protein n=1 Tax=Pediculus humanus subsp. corporis TaxID=121224 RepID=E0VWI8_PEDHC|nr:oxysterol binding protein 9, putative [Pediculus humanus corporis]EEB17745.1 oxysterol binding protein 9, putative [Pediculus humanus corporis]
MTRPSLEGPLTKWTNVMKGWQHRWFVLDENSGLLSYYTSREKMMRGVRRGCVRLKGAILGIDNEEDGNFTITTDSKTFHFQARNLAEREVWVRALEDTILRHAVFTHEHQVQPIVFLRKHMPHQLLKVHFEEEEDCSYETNMKKFDNRISQADVLLQMLIEQTQSLDSQIDGIEDESLKSQLGKLSHNYNLLVGGVKLAIVLLQILKLQHQHQQQQPRRGSRELLPSDDNTSETQSYTEPTPGTIELGSDCLNNPILMPAVIESLSHVASPEGMTLIVPPEIVPETSYSSSDDDEDFFDADDDLNSSVTANRTTSANFIVGNGVKESSSTQLTNVPGTSKKSSSSGASSPPVRIDGSLDYDALYEDDEDQSDISMENHGSMITHLLSQVKIGMDLTKVVLPTFILETRSLLEMYADYFAHPDMFVSIADKKTPKDRMVQVVKWYMSAYHAGRKSTVAKKPYNPILGEIFQCYWNIPGFTETADSTPVDDGPMPWCTRGQLAFIAEQVSHHPPISAFYAECVAKKICFEAFVYTKSKFLGLSVGVHNIGHGTVHVLDFKEDYVLTFPSGYGRSILTTPWIELGGTVTISCKKSGYNANIEFHTKPFYGGKKHRITGEIYGPSEKKPFITISGEWNGVMESKNAETGRVEVFVDVLKTPVTKKIVQSVFEQKENESRNLWKDVTAGLRLNDIDKATMAKTMLEQKQRDEAKKRRDTGTSWETKLFYEKSEGDWRYKTPLSSRQEDSSYITSVREQ